MATDNANKDWDYANPFHRINSPSYQLSENLADGLGYLRGCHAPSDGPHDTVYGLLIRDLIRTVPGWIPVRDEAEYEVEGSLFHSFQTWTDVPVWQWHRWYDWNFHITPDQGYGYVAGPGNAGPSPKELNEMKKRGERWLGKAGSLECEWDCGAFGEKPGAMFSGDWAWPLTGQRVWIAGRWIYDCGHASSDDKSIGKMRTELHPCKAVASARWEAVNFPENGSLYVPAIQFMFFASTIGGYYPFSSLGGRDYEFIVDLPKIPGAPAVSAPIGSTPEFPLNTVALRTPHLLHKFDYAPYSSAAGTKASVVPVIEPIPSSDPSLPPQQAKIKIPLSGASGQSYGVIISLGWYDPDGSQARKVFHCQVRLDNLHKGTVKHDTFSEEWSIKIGVNGRWYTQYFDGVRNNTTLTLKAAPIDIWLSEDDFISISSHGAEIDEVGGFFERPQEGRTSFIGHHLVDWNRDVMSRDQRTQWDICYSIADMMIFTFGIENDALGIIDPGPLPLHPANAGQKPGVDVAFSNPIQLKYLSDTTIVTGFNAFAAESDPHSAELEEKTGWVDYTLNLTIKVQRQRVP
jgi:hypothetical protein